MSNSCLRDPRTPIHGTGDTACLGLADGETIAVHSAGLLQCDNVDRLDWSETGLQGLRCGVKLNAAPFDA